MPEKSVREMNKFELRHYALATRTFRATLAGSIVLGLVALLIGLGLYAYALAGRYVNSAFSLSKNVSGIICKVADVEKISEQVMTAYRSMTDGERADQYSGEYRSRFAAIEESRDYKAALEVLSDFMETSDVFDVYIGMYDEETCSIVYIADPGDGDGGRCLPGEHEPVNRRGLEKFLNWDGKGTLYDIDKTEKYGWLATSAVPVKNAGGETVAFILADTSLANVASGVKSFFLQYAIAMFVAVNLVGIVMARRIKKKLAEPINRIAVAAEEYAADRKSGSDRCDHFSRLNISTGDEIENLALTMADMENDLTRHEEYLAAVTAEKERVGAELSLATRIQADMLPNIFPAFPDRPDFDIYATMTPAKEVGGDFYDFFLTDPDHLALVIADVSGKGIPAALFMMATKILIKNHTNSGLSPAEVLCKVNEQICANNREEMFVTVWLGILDLTNGHITAANAGHEYPVMKKAGGDYEIVKDRHGFVIGGMKGVRYREYELNLDKGGKLFVYTDGVAEATNEDGELFGTGRMVAALSGAKDRTPEETLGAVADAVELFVGNAPQFDDITMMCVEYKGGAPMERGVEMTVEATVENIPSVTEFVERELEKIDCPMKAVMQIDVAIDELFGNIAHYAYDPDTGPATVRVEVEEDPMAVIITFIDNGKPYDPLSAEDPDTTLSAEERKIGGLGVFLVKKTMDDVSYEYRNGQNILKIKKRV